MNQFCLPRSRVELDDLPAAGGRRVDFVTTSMFSAVGAVIVKADDLDVGILL